MKKIKLRKSEVLRYLGYRDQALDRELTQMIDSCMEEMEQATKAFYVYQTFQIQHQNDGIKLVNTRLILKGAAIASHLKGCSQCVMMAATLGVGVDLKIKRYQHTDMTRAVILDACASEAIEVLCDHAESVIKNGAAPGSYLTGRFSPGYGDLSVELQPELIKLLEADKKIGLTVTDHHFLVPRKSVTACIGISKDPTKKVAGCEGCLQYQHCSYRKGGSACAEFDK
ncbi:methionine synthase [Alkaliphilus crotonatoxidans]